MALEWLKDILGDTYTEDIDKKVSAEVGKAFVARKDFNTANEAKKSLEKDLADRDKQLEELKAVDAAGLQTKIKEMQEANEEAAKQHAAAINAVKLNYALDTKLMKEGAVNTKAVRALLDMDKVKLDGDNLLGVDDQLTALKETEKWAFGKTTSTGLPHGGDAGGGDKLSGVEAAFYKRNPDLKKD